MEKLDYSLIFETDMQLLAPDWLYLPEGPASGYSVVVSQGQFLAIGPRTQIAQQYPQLTEIRLPGRLIMPGFIDTHHHLTQTFGKSLVFGEPSEIFRRVWLPLEGSLDEEAVYLAAKLAALECLRGGFTTACDAGSRSPAGIEAIATATREVGLRCVLGLICNDLDSSGTPMAAGPIQSRAEKHLASCGSELTYPSLAISIPEAASDEMLGRISALCAEADCVFQTHTNEHLAAIERSLEKRRLRPLEHLYAAGALGPQALLAHTTLTTPTELRLLRDTGAAVCYNPVASAWKGNGVAAAELMDAFDIRVGLGTDGTRSDAFRLMDAAETSQRLVFGLFNGDSSGGGGKLWLDCATKGGADVLGLSTLIGRIEEGRAADFLVMDVDVPEMQPSWDLTWELVRLANKDQIEAVVVNGALCLVNGWPVDWDGRTLMHEVSAMAHTVVENAPIQKIHPFTHEYVGVLGKHHRS